MTPTEILAAMEPAGWRYTHQATDHTIPYFTDDRDAFFAALQGSIEVALYTADQVLAVVQAVAGDAIEALDRARHAADGVLAPICADVGRYLYDGPDENLIAVAHDYGVVVPAKAFGALYDATHPDIVDALRAATTPTPEASHD